MSLRVEGDGPAVGLDHAQDHAEGGGFARPVSAQEPDDFLLARRKLTSLTTVRPL